MCNLCNNQNCCEPMSGNCVIYTGPNITTPFTFDTHSTFNEFVLKVAEYLGGLSPSNKTLTVETTPSNATVVMNGVTTNSMSAATGTQVTIEVSATGYQTSTVVYYVGNQDETIHINLVPIPQNVTVNFVSNPSGATITVNGVTTSSYTGVPGTTVLLTANLAGYLPYSDSYTLPNASTTHTINLTPEPQPTFTLTFLSNPPGATIKVNGVDATTFTGTTGQTCTVTATLAGYNNFSATYTVGSSNQTITLNLTPELPTYTYYFGEAGVIYALSPSNITQSNWGTHIKPKLNVYNHTNLQNSYSGDAVVNAYQWWILLIPSSAAAWVSQLPLYKWQTLNQLDNTWVDYDATDPEIGTVVLDGIEYTYLAIQPPYAVKIRLIKN